jgi:Carboxypeptidase regulatory-like domain
LRYLCIFPMLLLILCAATCVLSQSTDATISGVVVDPAGKVIQDATIEILNEATGVHYSSQTNGFGIYTVPILPPGEYRVQVSKVGFKTLIKPGIILNVQSALVINFTLPLGAASESVTVEAGTTTINTTDGSVSTVIDRKFVENIPLNGRSFQDLISMTPGTVTQTPQGYSSPGADGDFSVNGQRTESNYYTVDGVSANVGAGNGYGAAQPANSGSIAATTALGTTQSLVSVDALQEFRVESSTYSAEYGRTPGGQFSFATRSGTNQYHGSTFDYLRNDFFDANDWFNDHYEQSKTALRQNDFGATLGGRLAVPGLYSGKDKSFFFASYEGLRLTQPQAATIQYVPDESLRTNAPAALQAILNAFPEPTAGGIDFGNLAQFIQSYSLPSEINAYSIRIDQSFSPKVSAFFRFGDTPSVSSSRLLSSLTQQHLNTQTYTLGVTTQLSQRIANEFRLGYANSNSNVSTTVDSFGGAEPAGLANGMGIGASNTTLAQFYVYIPGVGGSYIDTEQAANQGRQWNLTDSWSLTAGRHQFKAGVDFRHISSPTDPPNTTAVALFYSDNSVLTDSADELDIYKRANSTPIFNEIAVFAQDEWRANRRLNISSGLRWEINPPPSRSNGNYPYTLLGNIDDPSTLTLAPEGTPLWNTTFFNLAPRLGLAWQAHNRAGRETIIRTGAGVFFDTDNEFATLGFGGLGFFAFNSYYGVPIPATSDQLDFTTSAVPPYTSSTVYAFPRHLQLPYTLQWNTALQQALGKQQTVTLSYVASNGRRLLLEQLRSIQSVNPNFSSIAYLATGPTSNYQSLQIQFQRTMTSGVQALASYTWSHSLDYGSTYSALALTRGNSDYDVRHNLQGGISWDIPSRHNTALLSAVTRGWGLDGRLMARTGFPITLFGNYLTDASTGQQYYTNVDLVPNEPIYLHGAIYPGGRALNPNAFAYPVGNDPGDAPRNFVRGFGEAQINLAARREFHLGESLRVQFRAETFNLPNHPNFGYVDPYLTDATFGQATQMLNQSLGTVAAQYQQGGPRSMQFALKILF